MRYLSEVLRHRIPALNAIYFGNPFSGKLDGRSLAKADADLVYCHSNYPLNAGDVPVFWRNAVLDPDMQLWNGRSQKSIDLEIDQKRPWFEAASMIHVSTAAEVVRMGRVYPALAKKFIDIPYFLPHLVEAINEHQAIAKLKASPVEIAFVGRHAYRKGLDIVVEALRRIGAQSRNDLRITIVSDMSDGDVSLPSWANLRHVPIATRADVARLMDRCSIFVMPSRFESYGIVYIEAMSRGAIPIVPDWEVQREIVGNGEAGFPVKHDPDCVAQALDRLVTDVDLRLSMGLSAVRRFERLFKAPIVAQRFAEAFLRCRRRG